MVETYPPAMAEAAKIAREHWRTSSAYRIGLVVGRGEAAAPPSEELNTKSADWQRHFQSGVADAATAKEKTHANAQNA